MSDDPVGELRVEFGLMHFSSYFILLFLVLISLSNQGCGFESKAVILHVEKKNIVQILQGRVSALVMKNGVMGAMSGKNPKNF